LHFHLFKSGNALNVKEAKRCGARKATEKKTKKQLERRKKTTATENKKKQKKGNKTLPLLTSFSHLHISDLAARYPSRGAFFAAAS
jgi:hypothetical protein